MCQQEEGLPVRGIRETADFAHGQILPGGRETDNPSRGERETPNPFGHLHGWRLKNSLRGQPMAEEGEAEEGG